MPPASPGDEDMGKPAQVGGLSQLPGLAWARARALATHMLRTGKKFRNTGQWEKMPRQDSSNNSISTKSDPKGASYITTHLHTYTAHQKEAAQCTAKLPSSPGAPPSREHRVISHTAPGWAQRPAHDGSQEISWAASSARAGCTTPRQGSEQTLPSPGTETLLEPTFPSQCSAHSNHRGPATRSAFKLNTARVCVCVSRARSL